jgi:hypothetical protein
MHYARKALGVTSSKDAGGVVRGAPIDGLGDSAGNSWEESHAPHFPAIAIMH